MEQKFYTVLWIDDEHESLSGTKGRAKRNGINLIPFKSMEAGLNELERNALLYDGILLDAKFFEHENDERGTEDTQFIFETKDRLMRLKKQFDLFVLTGQAEAYDDKTFNKVFKNIYRKGNDEDINKLFIDIKTYADQLEDTQVRHKYKRVFEACTEKYIGNEAGQKLLLILKDIETENVRVNFNSCRVLIEHLFLAFQKNELLPIEFVHPTVRLNESSKFLSGYVKDDEILGYKHHEKSHLPKIIASLIRNILEITQPGSHVGIVDDHQEITRTDFLIKSVVFQICEVYVWFKNYLDTQPTTKNWERVELRQMVRTDNSGKLVFGTVINLSTLKGFAFLKPDDMGDNIYIPREIVNKFNLLDGKKVKGEIQEYIDNNSGELKKKIVNIIQ